MKPMWKTNWLDQVWFTLMLIFTGISAYTGHGWAAGLFGICAGNQIQICLAGAWWGHLRKLHQIDRDCAVDIFEDQM